MLIGFLETVLKSQISPPIQELTFLKTIQDPEIASKKQSVVDVVCQDQKGSYYIVEMQVAIQTGFEARAQYYASKAYTSQMGEGDQYKDVKEVFMIMLCFVVPQNYEESLYYKKLMRMSQKQLI